MIEVYSELTKEKLPVEFMNFPDNESFVKFDYSGESLNIVWKYENDSELISLGLLYDIIRQNTGWPEVRFDYVAAVPNLNLFVPYFPHARQDREEVKSQPFSLRVISQILNSFFRTNYANEKVFCLDIHSNALKKLIEYVDFNNIPSSNYSDDIETEYDYIICPDKGAVDRCDSWGNKRSTPVLYCQKVRDPSTGKLSDPILPDIDLKDKRVLLVDDIGTGFGTHVMLAEQFHNRHSNLTMDLWVTHSSWTRGKDIVLKVFDHVYTTDSLKGATQQNSDKITVFDCTKYFFN